MTAPQPRPGEPPAVAWVPSTDELWVGGRLIRNRGRWLPLTVGNTGPAPASVRELPDDAVQLIVPIQEHGALCDDIEQDRDELAAALVEIGMALGLPQPTPEQHWGALEILAKIAAHDGDTCAEVEQALEQLEGEHNELVLKLVRTVGEPNRPVTPLVMLQRLVAERDQLRHELDQADHFGRGEWRSRGGASRQPRATADK